MGHNELQQNRADGERAGTGTAEVRVQLVPDTGRIHSPEQKDPGQQRPQLAGEPGRHWRKKGRVEHSGRSVGTAGERRQLIGECANRGRGLRPRWTGLDSLEKVTGNTKEGCANLLEMTERSGPSLLEPGHREPGPDVEPGVGPSGAEALEHKKGLSNSRSSDLESPCVGIQSLDLPAGIGLWAGGREEAARGWEGRESGQPFWEVEGD